jgi:hypothetical protein
MFSKGRADCFKEDAEEGAWAGADADPERSVKAIFWIPYETYGSLNAAFSTVFIYRL